LLQLVQAAAIRQGGVLKVVERPILSRSFSPPTAQLAADISVVVSSWFAVLLLSNITEQFKRDNAPSLLMVAVGSAVTLAIMKRRGLYAGRPALPRTDEISAVFVAALGGTSAVAVLAAFLDWHIGAWELLWGWTIVFSGRTLVRGLLRAVAAEVPSVSQVEKVVIVGTGEEAKELADLIEDHPESRLVLAGVVGNLAVAERSGLIDRWIGPAGRLIELMHQRGATGAIVTATGFRGEQFRAISRELFEAGYDVQLTTGVSHEPLVVMARNRTRSSHRMIKRAMDLVLASLAVTLLLPIMILVAAIIWLEDRGPVTYTSQRVGRRGELFPMYKFRSMITNAEALKADMEQDNERSGPLFKMSNDPRITRVGRLIRETSLDELPQLFNVIRGDMSLVGPRPPLPEEQAVFDDELKDRFVVRPGITGLWQVEARSNASFNAYRRLDLHYVENWSLGLDLRILLATAEQVVVSLALVPLRLLRRNSSADAIVSRSAEVPAKNSPRLVPTRIPGSESLVDVVVDLRQRSLARQVVAAEARPATAPTGSTRQHDR
jgi:exopolysaccharide biosynthesis polyprenyl glycosylphosphotransferase